MSDRYIVPKRLDDPELIGFWTLDEFAGMIVPFTWGILGQHVFIGIALAAASWFALRKAKAGRSWAWVIHAAYPRDLLVQGFRDSQLLQRQGLPADPGHPATRRPGLQPRGDAAPPEGRAGPLRLCRHLLRVLIPRGLLHQAQGLLLL